MAIFDVDPGLIASVNAVAEFLALDQFGAERRDAGFDMIVLAGNAILATADAAFEQAKTARVPVLITGGIGHSTTLLAEAVATLHPGIALGGRPEAEILRDMALRIHGLDPEQVLVEAASTNCGENAEFTRRRLKERDLRPSRVLLIQDPLMQRRTDASFRRAWRESSWRTEFVNWPTFVPRLELNDGRIEYAAGLPDPLWAGDRFLSLLVGEIPRLRDDANGYGPRGRDFIAHVDIPFAVEQHHRRLINGIAKDGTLLSRSID